MPEEGVALMILMSRILMDTDINFILISCHRTLAWVLQSKVRPKCLKGWMDERF